MKKNDKTQRKWVTNIIIQLCHPMDVWARVRFAKPLKLKQTKKLGGFSFFFFSFPLFVLFCFLFSVSFIHIFFGWSHYFIAWQFAVCCEQRCSTNVCVCVQKLFCLSQYTIFSWAHTQRRQPAASNRCCRIQTYISVWYIIWPSFFAMVTPKFNLIFSICGAQ